MAIPLRNAVFDKIKEAGSLTDAELYKALAKDCGVISEAKFNKMLLDLEIMGLIKVAWITKDDRRIEACVEQKEPDPVDEQDRKAVEKDYEASFPGFEK